MIAKEEKGQTIVPLIYTVAAALEPLIKKRFELEHQ